MKKLISLVLAMMMLLSVSLACAKTLEPDDTEFERLSGSVVHATVGAYDEQSGTFRVTLFEEGKDGRRIWRHQGRHGRRI